MNLKKLAEQKIDELSGKITPEQIMENAENESVEIILEGLDEITSKIEEEDSEELSIELISEDNFGEDSEENDIELSQEPQPRIKKDLFAGYLGELSEAPNPLEYGANATYRNLREGIVYKKGPDNLWEVFVKDGKPGRQGPSAPGGGCGVQEVKSIVENRITSAPIIATYPGTPANPFATTAELPAVGAYVNQTVFFALPSVQNADIGELRWNGATWVPVGERRIVFAASKDVPVINVAPGVAAGTPVKIWESEIVPDIFLPDFSQFTMRCLVGVRNSTAQVAGCKLLIGFNGGTPYDYNDYTWPAAAIVTPPSVSSAYRGFTTASLVPKVFQRVGTMFKVGDIGQGSSWPQSNNHGPFVSGANRAQVWVVPSHVADVFQIDLIEIIALGNI